MFYKLEDGILPGGSETVIGPLFELYTPDKDTYSYPVDGWYWFADENAARSFFGLPLLVQDEQGQWIEE